MVNLNTYIGQFIISYSNEQIGSLLPLFQNFSGPVNVSQSPKDSIPTWFKECISLFDTITYYFWKMTLTCIECKSESPKYKCSTCYISYCSSNCWKKHRESAECKKPESILYVPNTVKQRNYITEDTIDLEKLSRLGSNNDLKKLLKDPLLQKLLLGVDVSSDPYDSIQKAMQDPSFMQFVDICLKTVEEKEY